MDIRPISSNSVNFKYTRNRQRIAWVDAIGPHALRIASILPNIQWDTFQYNGRILIDVIPDMNQPDTNQISERHDVAATASGPVNYQVFGGGACELWGLEENAVPIRKYSDFTGDLDVSVELPEITVTDAVGLPDTIINESVILLNQRNEFTQFGDEFTHWLFNQVVAQTFLISNMFNAPPFALPTVSECTETAVSDLHTFAGNLLITRTPMFDRNMIKIQISTKVIQGSISMMDHLVEFIMLTKGTIHIPDSSRETIRGISVMTPLELLQSQVKGGFDGRGVLYMTDIIVHPERNIDSTPDLYKMDNHCARVLYLATLQAFMKMKQSRLYIMKHNKTLDSLPNIASNNPHANRYKGALAPQLVLQMLISLYKTGSYRLCSHHFGNTYMEKLLTVFDPFVTKFAKVQQDKLNIAKAEGGKLWAIHNHAVTEYRKSHTVVKGRQSAPTATARRTQSKVRRQSAPTATARRTQSKVRRQSAPTSRITRRRTH